jgi:hypothetical protein
MYEQSPIALSPHEKHSSYDTLRSLSKKTHPRQTSRRTLSLCTKSSQHTHLMYEQSPIALSPHEKHSSYETLHQSRNKRIHDKPHQPHYPFPPYTCWLSEGAGDPFPRTLIDVPWVRRSLTTLPRRPPYRPRGFA